jgi:hypothetical protein
LWPSRSKTDDKLDGRVRVSRRRQGGREKLLASGVLDRFDDKTDPKVLEEAEQIDY